jgi:hypothetical protein
VAAQDIPCKSGDPVDPALKVLACQRASDHLAAGGHCPRIVPLSQWRRRATNAQTASTAPNGQADNLLPIPPAPDVLQNTLLLSASDEFQPASVGEAHPASASRRQAA